MARKNQKIKREFSARFVKGGNIKVGKMWIWNTLKGGDVIHIDYRGKSFQCAGTCGKLCKDCGCDKACYVNASYNIYPSVKYGHARNTIAMRQSYANTFEELYNQLKRARNKPTFVRIHASGEFEDVREIEMFNALALAFPQVVFYTYSKNFPVWDAWLNENKLADNFILNVSIWHGFGIPFFMRWSHLPNVRAYVYDDGYNYTADGLKIDCHCPAYKKDGKLIHEKTCDKCGLCMLYGNRCKVVGCYAH